MKLTRLNINQYILRNRRKRLRENHSGDITKLTMKMIGLKKNGKGYLISIVLMRLMNLRRL